MTKDEKAALTWLESWDGDGPPETHGAKKRAILKAMLGRPVLPEMLSSADAQTIVDELTCKYGVNISPAELGATFLAIRARLTKPNQREEAMTEEEKARPVLPAEPTAEIVTAMLTARGKADREGLNPTIAMYRAIYAHLTKPKTREVEVKATALLNERGDIIGFSYADSQGIYRTIDVSARSASTTARYAFWKQGMPTAELGGKTEIPA